MLAVDAMNCSSYISDIYNTSLGHPQVCTQELCDAAVEEESLRKSEQGKQQQHWAMLIRMIPIVKDTLRQKIEIN